MVGGSAGASAHERNRARHPPFVRRGTRSRAQRAGQDHRLYRLPAHPAVQFADQHPAHHRRRIAAVVHHRSGAGVPAGRCGLDRNRPDACLADNAGHPVGACWPYIAGEVQPVHLRILSGGRAMAGQPDLHPRRAAAAAAVDPAAPGQGAQRRDCSSSPFRWSRSSCCTAAAWMALASAGWRACCRDWPTASAAPAGPCKRGRGPVIGPLLLLLGKLLVLLGTIVSWLILPLTWLPTRSRLARSRCGSISRSPRLSSRSCCSCSPAASAPAGAH